MAAPEDIPSLGGSPGRPMQLIVAAGLAVLLAWLWRRRARQPIDLRGERVLVTGGAHGIGLALAERLLQVGATVVIADVNTGVPLAASPRLHVFRCDVGDAASVAGLHAAIRAGLGAMPTVLVNNAGIQNQGKELCELAAGEIERIVATNLLGVLQMTRTFLPAMLEADRGHVVNVASCLGLGGLNRLTDYCATKFGVVGFNEALRLELKAGGARVRTTVVCPFLVRTGMFARVRVRHPWLTRPLEPGEVADAMLDAIRYGDVEELVMPAVFRLFPLVRLAPCWVYDWLQMALGSCDSYEAA